MFEISLLSNWLDFFQTCDVWDLPSSKLNGFGQYFMVLIRNCSVHSWHLNFSPQIASVQTLKWPSAIASRPFESLHWCNFGEKFKCHSCDGTISITIFKASKLMLLPLLAMLVINLLVFVLSNPSKVSPNPMLEQFSKTKFYHKMQLVTS